MIHFFYTAFEEAPYPCFWLSHEGQFWQNSAAEESPLSGLVQTLMQGTAQGGKKSQAIAEQLTGALRLGGVTLMPVSGGVFAACPEGGAPLMQMFSAEMREPLTNIYAILPLIYKKLEDEDTIYIDQIQDNCYQLLRMAANLETAGRLEAKPLRPRPLDLTALVDSLCVCVRSVCRGQGVDIGLRLPEEPLVVLGEGTLVSEAILNLLRNALLYTRDGNEITLTLYRAGKRAVLTVEDRGLGIRPEHLGHIFEPYFSADPYGDSGQRPGLGLGLSITQRAVQALGGSVAVESRFGEGTRITLALPLADPDAADVLRSDPADYLLNRYSAVYVQLCGLCRLPVV